MSNQVDPRQLPTVEQVAKEFARVVIMWLTPSQFSIMRYRNSKQLDKSICHSHDFIDANMAMDQAFKTFGIDPLENPIEPEGGMTEEVVTLWNSAWDMAKKHYL